MQPEPTSVVGPGPGPATTPIVLPPSTLELSLPVPGQPLKEGEEISVQTVTM